MDPDNVRTVIFVSLSTMFIWISECSNLTSDALRLHSTGPSRSSCSCSGVHPLQQLGTAFHEDAAPADIGAMLLEGQAAGLTQCG